MATSSTPRPATAPRVLIAEDQPDVVEAIRMVLKQEGYDTRAANSPKAVMEALAADSFDLLLMDLNYTRDTTSGSEGLDLLAEVQRCERELPVIVMTAWGSVELAVEAMRRGAVDFIQKPWDNWRLIGMVRNQMQRQQELRKRESEAEREMREAGEIQKRLLPRHITQIPGIDLAVDWKPARTLGGDYFDVLRFSDGSVGLCIADVEGKGVPAALVMSNLQSAVKAFAGPAVEPRALCQRMNLVFCEDVQTERSISMVYARLDPKTLKLTYTNAGHWPPLLVHRDGGDVELLQTGGALLGRLSYWQYEHAEVQLQSGDLVLFFTDGVTEAANAAEEEFGDARMAEFALSWRERSASALQKALFAEVARFCDNRFHDDATLMVLGIQ